MNRIQVFNVAPSIPREIRFLEELARNMWWCWNDDAIEVFRRINPNRWVAAGRNPLVLLRMTPQDELEELSTDKAFMAHLAEVQERFDSELTGAVTPGTEGCIGYFSLEFGIHESCRLYSGGLGVLAGDHLKAASDAHVPLVAIGLLYREGFFQQYLNEDGWQQEHYSDVEIQALPVRRALDSDGNRIAVSVPLPEGPLHAAVWRMNIGRVPLYLLDTHLPENLPELRSITGQLYGGDKLMRLRQEILLGIGGVRALIAAGYNPDVYHINEGHAAFLSLARIEHLSRTHSLDHDTAIEVVERTNVFTTHTPVPAGNETFAKDLILPHLKAIEAETGIKSDDVMRWGRPPGSRDSDELSMTILGLRFAHRSNGVSKLHGEVARGMWQHLWPGRADDETPIRHVTNGVHVPSWISAELSALLDRYTGPAWRENPAAPHVAENVEQIPNEDLWRAHETCRARLIRTARMRMEEQYSARNATRVDIEAARSVFDHDTLTIGFARRFASYKRGTLLLREADRLRAMLTNRDHPVQFIFAGKAHPHDNPGKDLIRHIVHFAREADVRHRIVFLENYDICLARYMVQGVDVWLNTPRRPHEASGTSGMKAAANGGLHASVLDGWWCEGYSPDRGWAIGRGDEYDDEEYHDQVEASALFNLLEDEIIPCFYDRRGGGNPERWIEMMKASISMALGQFTSRRMIEEYRDTFYNSAAADARNLLTANAARAGELVRQRARLASLWDGVASEVPVVDSEATALHVGDRFRVQSIVTLGELRPDEVDVEVYYGPIDSKNQIIKSNVAGMELESEQGDGRHLYGHEITCRESGRYGFTTRVVPRGSEWAATMPGFITWANGETQS